MIGGYAPIILRRFNYYGTVGSNRDEFVRRTQAGECEIGWKNLIPKMSPNDGDRSMKIRAQIGMVLNLDKCIGCHTCSVTCKNVWTNREGVNTHGLIMWKPNQG